MYKVNQTYRTKYEKLEILEKLPNGKFLVGFYTIASDGYCDGSINDTAEFSSQDIDNWLNTVEPHVAEVEPQVAGVKMHFHAVMIDETGCEFGVGIDATSKAEAIKELREQYPESLIDQIESPEDTKRRQQELYARIQQEHDDGYW